MNFKIKFIIMILICRTIYCSDSNDNVPSVLSTNLNFFSTANYFNEDEERYYAELESSFYESFTNALFNFDNHDHYLPQILDNQNTLGNFIQFFDDFFIDSVKNTNKNKDNKEGNNQR